MLFLKTAALVVGLCLSPASAIFVASGSPCERLCGNVLDSTNPDDIVCDENAYSSSAEGVVFQQCSTCQLTSDYSAGIEHDTQWLLYNLRYAVSYCLFGYPENDAVTSSPCLTETACEPLHHAITFNELAPNTTAYGYCSTWLFDQMPRCADCLRAGGEHYLTNFLTILHAGCEQTPEDGRRIAVDGSPFSRWDVNITDGLPTATNLPNYYPGPLNLDARVGIAFGGLALLLMVLGFCIICQGRRKRRTFLKTLETRMKQGRGGWPTPINTNGEQYFDTPVAKTSQRGWDETPVSQRPLHGWNETPLSQKPLRDWEYSPQSTTIEKYPPGRFFSPYSSHYNSPDTAVDGREVTWPADKPLPSTSPQEIGLALGGPDTIVADSKKKGLAMEEDVYELTPVDTNYSSYRSGSVSRATPPTMYQPQMPVFAPYNPADYHDSPMDQFRRPPGSF